MSLNKLFASQFVNIIALIVNIALSRGIVDKQGFEWYGSFEIVMLN